MNVLGRLIIILTMNSTYIPIQKHFSIWVLRDITKIWKQIIHIEDVKHINFAFREVINKIKKVNKLSQNFFFFQNEFVGFFQCIWFFSELS